MTTQTHPEPLDIVAALEHRWATFDALVFLLKADRQAVDQARYEATQKDGSCSP